MDTAAKMETKQYLEYLDKEMTIMGILSAAAAIAPGGILSAVLGADSGAKATLWSTGQFFIVAGSMFCVLAALLFYKERSRLAWFYGQICLADILADPENRAAGLREWLRDADSWATWWPYSWGFTFLIAGCVESLLALSFFWSLRIGRCFLASSMESRCSHSWRAQSCRGSRRHCNGT